MTETVLSYAVTKRGPDGEPLLIQCRAHAECDWSMKSSGRKADNDPIFTAQWQNHMREAKVPTLQAFGHLRRSRADGKPR